MTERGHGWSVSGFGPGNGERSCPYCGEVVDSTREEIAHMSEVHPGIVSQRLVDAGIHPDEIADYRTGPDLPSFMTLSEMRVVNVLIERLAVEETWDNFQFNTEVSILVRDRGAESKLKAPWIEISVGGRQYAIWRATMALYEVDEHGAVKDDPIFFND